MATSIFCSLLLLFFLSCVTSSDQGNTYLNSSRIVSRATAEKQSHFRFYFHDIVSGPNPTAITLAEAPGTNTSATLFGLVVMIDDLLTTGPENNSRSVGRAQGFYASAEIEKMGLLMAMNFVFTDGKYNGSTIAILGHNEFLSPVREMPIVRGSGLFRFARGYVQARTHWLDQNTHDAIVEYNVFVNHY
ncbi:Dirigent protein [Rhynchospora pubera]|uniref:Dirigent protein n=1 Tax=Rhynchospora pubera TaxID=906938 RepID=A0AAV8GWG7_9POAL|nr:Dirigent protein [Rhynchospora pubera]